LIWGPLCGGGIGRGGEETGRDGKRQEERGGEGKEWNVKGEKRKEEERMGGELMAGEGEGP